MNSWPEEVLRAFHRSKFARDQDKQYELIVYRPVEALLQTGPQCGLVALAMAMNLNSMEITVENLFERAKKLNLTVQGEFFDVRDISKLGEEFNCNTKVQRWNEAHDLVESLKSNKICLVPYDADGNHEPCSKRGHRAHWLIAVGFLQETRRSERSSNDLILIHQGKSRNLAGFSLFDLFMSNSQLIEIDFQRRSTDEYRIPQGGSLEDNLGHFFVSFELQK